MERRKRRTSLFWQEERVPRVDFFRQYLGRKFRRSLVSLVSARPLAEWPGVFSVRQRHSVWTLIGTRWMGFTVKAYGYDHWDGECLNAATLSIISSLPADFISVTVRPIRPSAR